MEPNDSLKKEFTEKIVYLENVAVTCNVSDLVHSTLAVSDLITRGSLLASNPRYDLDALIIKQMNNFDAILAKAINTFTQHCIKK